MCGSLGGEPVDVAHGIARLERTQLYVRGHRIQSEPRVETIAVILERIEQGNGTVVGAEKPNIREVLKHSWPKYKLPLEGAQTELEAPPRARYSNPDG